METLDVLKAVVESLIHVEAVGLAIRVGVTL
jgi:hypothetical protein